MEELQSTDALDREILEDARKKALKILKSADDEAVSRAASWERRLEQKREEVRGKYAEKIAAARTEIMARLPMDKRRIRTEKIQTLLAGAMNSYLASLDRARLVSIVEKELAVRTASCDPGGGVSVRFRGLDGEELAALLAKTLAASPSSVTPDALYTVRGSFPALILESPRLRISASVDGAADQLLLDKRSELARSLLGPPAVEDGGLR
ncbi:MAG: ATPase [Treponema sp.]|jgi:vacuolar-type H+-ATPase subunit H|nr:ATPase [Treponema sp.]